jgi:hypothetical protein
MLGLISAAWTTPAFACPCGDKPPISNARDSASLVFLGRITGVTPSSFREGFNEVQVEVIKMIKAGEEEWGREITIYTPNLSGKCGFSFIAQLDYIIYAEGNPAFLRVTSCSRTTMFDTSKDEYRELVGATPPPSPSPSPKRTPKPITRPNQLEGLR